MRDRDVAPTARSMEPPTIPGRLTQAEHALHAVSVHPHHQALTAKARRSLRRYRHSRRSAIRARQRVGQVLARSSQSIRVGESWDATPAGSERRAIASRERDRTTAPSVGAHVRIRLSFSHRSAHEQPWLTGVPHLVRDHASEIPKYAPTYQACIQLDLVGHCVRCAPCTLTAHRQVRNGADLARREQREDLISRRRAHAIVRGVLDALVLRYRQASGAVTVLVFRRVRAETEGIREVDWISAGIPIQVEPTRQPDRVLLRGLTRSRSWPPLKPTAATVGRPRSNASLVTTAKSAPMPRAA